jgi:hypothetical protein
MGAQIVMRSQATPFRLAIATVVLAVIVSGVIVLIGSAKAGRHDPAPPVAPIGASNVERLSVLTRAATPRSAAAYAAARKLPVDAVRAETFGSAEVYVSETHEEICLTIIEGLLEDNTCGRDFEVLQHGLVAIWTQAGNVRVDILTPNGVRKVTLIDHDGAHRQIAVTNNVAEVYDSHVATVRYPLPHGGWQVERIPASELKPQRAGGRH